MCPILNCLHIDFSVRWLHNLFFQINGLTIGERFINSLAHVLKRFPHRTPVENDHRRQMQELFC